MAKFNFNLRNPGKLSVCPIYLIIRYSNLKLVYPTGERMPPEFWNKSNQRAKIIKSYPDGTYLNERLGEIERTAMTVVRTFSLDNDGSVPSISELRKELDIAFGKEVNLKGLSFFDFIEKFIEEAPLRTNLSTGKPLSRGTLQIYKHTYTLLKEYSQYRKVVLDFRDINQDFYYDFVEFLKLHRELSNNTIGKHIRTIKVFLNDATERGVNKYLSYRSKKFRLESEYNEKIYLTEKELDEIFKTDFSDLKRLDRVRDLFLVGCWTGLRFSDLAKLNETNLDEGYLKIRTQKTDEEVIIPIHPVVQEILDKYKSEFLPNVISNAKMNAYLKEVMIRIPSLVEPINRKVTKSGRVIVEKARKCDLVTVHTARRSFATNQYLSGFPTISIMKITGHRTESSFLEYIKVTPKENAELLKKHWEDQIKAI